MALAHSIKDLARPNGPFCRQTIYDAINTGDLKAKKHGTRTIILDEDYRSWLRSLPDYEADAKEGRHNEAA